MDFSQIADSRPHFQKGQYRSSEEFEPDAVNMSEKEKKGPTVAAKGTSSSSRASTGQLEHGHDSTLFHLDLEIEDYFKGPRDIYKHSKWPYFLRMHGSM